MDNPVIAGIKPIKVKLIKGQEYHFCTCGRSNSQPFCDGSHVGTSFHPKVIVSDKDDNAFLCSCKYTKNTPYCDGSHKKFTSEMIGTEGPSLDDVVQNEEPVTSTIEESTLEFIHELAHNRLENFGAHGPMTSMGVPRDKLPHWDDIQIMTAQFSTKPLQEECEVTTKVIIGPNAKKPLVLDIPLFVSDMSFGSLSEEAKIALARGAELSGTGISSGEGGMLAEEQQENSKYFYEYASGEFGYSDEILTKIQAFHFKGGQGAKTGIGGHLPASKNIGKISKTRKIPEGVDAISPATFRNLKSVEDFKNFANHVREVSGGIPIGFKISANHIEKDIQFALDVGTDYIILDGRGGSTGASPEMFRDHISVPTIPALARARRYLNEKNARGNVTLIITGGLRVPIDFVKAMALGADAIALSNSVIQSIGCVGARICNTNNCPAGIATQKIELRQKLNIEKSAQQLERFFKSSTSLMKMMAKACGHNELNKLNKNDLSTWKKEMALLSGVKYSGFADIE